MTSSRYSITIEIPAGFSMNDTEHSIENGNLVARVKDRVICYTTLPENLCLERLDIYPSHDANHYRVVFPVRSLKSV